MSSAYAGHVLVVMSCGSSSQKWRAWPGLAFRHFQRFAGRISQGQACYGQLQSKWTVPTESITA
eukprot:854133-Amphidinium_carterae.1